MQQSFHQLQSLEVLNRCALAKGCRAKSCLSTHCSVCTIKDLLLAKTIPCLKTRGFFWMAVNQCHFTFGLLKHLTHAHAKYGCSGLHFCSELMSI